MYETNISINLRPIREQVSIIDIQGGLTAAAETVLMDTFSQASDAGAQFVLLGFEELTYMNSAGIGLLVRLVIRAQRQGQQVLAFGLQEHYRRIFELTHLQEVIRTYDTETEALTAVLAPS
jgi:anti-sigma B factor antagonist